MKKIKRNLIQIGASALIFMSGYAAAMMKIKNKTTFAGNLRIDESEPGESPRMFLELTTGINDICKTKIIKLQVVKDNYLKK